MIFLKKRLLIFFSLFTILIISVTGVIIYSVLMTDNLDLSDSEDEAQQVNLAVEKKLVLITHYRVGEDTVDSVIENLESIDDLKKMYPEWKIVKENSQEITLERTLEDLSPDLKKGSYFGLGPDGYLTLYRGDPKDNHVVETFFRIDIEKLESVLPKEPVEQLYKGIPVEDLAEFNSVLSTFSEFSLD